MRSGRQSGIRNVQHSRTEMWRLSIIDLGGRHQPIYSATGRQAIVFNGEAYNFQERCEELIVDGVSLKTAIDTKVVLQHYLKYTKSFPEKINGMFGLVIWGTT